MRIIIHLELLCCKENISYPVLKWLNMSIPWMVTFGKTFGVSMPVTKGSDYIHIHIFISKHNFDKSYHLIYLILFSLCKESYCTKREYMFLADDTDVKIKGF